MNIALITESYWPNVDGGAVFEHHLVKGMIGKGHNVLVFTPSKDGKHTEEQDSGSTIVRLTSHLLPFNKLYRYCLWPSKEITSRLDAFKPDIIHIHTPTQISIIARNWAKKHHVPVMATNHFVPDNFLLELPWLKFLNKTARYFMWRYLIHFYNSVSYVTSPTKTAIDILKKQGLKTPCAPASNGIDVNYFTPGRATPEFFKKYNLPMDKPIVLYTGRVAGEKRLDIWLRMIPIVREKVDCHFLIGGRGPSEEMLKKLIIELGIQEHVTFIGFVSEPELAEIYRTSKVFVITSPVELQSIVTLEALATGLPIVSCDECALPEIVHHGENGFLVPYEDFQTTAEQVIRVLTDDQQYERFSKESRRIAETHAFPKTVDNYERIYNELIVSFRK